RRATTRDDYFDSINYTSDGEQDQHHGLHLQINSADGDEISLSSDENDGASVYGSDVFGGGSDQYGATSDLATPARLLTTDRHAGGHDSRNSRLHQGFNRNHDIRGREQAGAAGAVLDEGTHLTQGRSNGRMRDRDTLGATTEACSPDPSLEASFNTGILDEVDGVTRRDEGTEDLQRQEMLVHKTRKVNRHLERWLIRGRNFQLSPLQQSVRRETKAPGSEQCNTKCTGIGVTIAVLVSRTVIAALPCGLVYCALDYYNILSFRLMRDWIGPFLLLPLFWWGPIFLRCALENRHTECLEEFCRGSRDTSASGSEHARRSQYFSAIGNQNGYSNDLSGAFPPLPHSLSLGNNSVRSRSSGCSGTLLQQCQRTVTQTSSGVSRSSILKGKTLSLVSSDANSCHRQPVSGPIGSQGSRGVLPSMLTSCPRGASSP
ncbi:unnamed protein product, partial [Amoebophrya sp. A25]